MNIHAHAFLKYTLCNNVSCLRTDLSLGLELMITEHKVLLMEMLSWGSVLTIIIVTYLAWKPISQDLSPWLHSQQYTSPRGQAQKPISLVNLVPKLSQDICLGKGSGGTLTTLRYSFYLSSATSWKVYNAPLKPVIFLSPSDVYVRSFFVTITLIKFLLHKALCDETVFGPGVKRSWSSSEVMNPVEHCKLSSITLGA